MVEKMTSDGNDKPSRRNILFGLGAAGISAAIPDVAEAGKLLEGVGASVGRSKLYEHFFSDTVGRIKSSEAGIDDREFTNECIRWIDNYLRIDKLYREQGEAVMTGKIQKAKIEYSGEDFDGYPLMKKLITRFEIEIKEFGEEAEVGLSVFTKDGTRISDSTASFYEQTFAKNKPRNKK